MLENGGPEARAFLEQLADAEVTSWRCACGCASLNFQIRGKPPAPVGVRILGDYMIDTGDTDRAEGIFIFESGGILSGVEVVGYGCDAPKTLPAIEQLRIV